MGHHHAPQPHGRAGSVWAPLLGHERLAEGRSPALRATERSHLRAGESQRALGHITYTNRLGIVKSV